MFFHQYLHFSFDLRKVWVFCFFVCFVFVIFILIFIFYIGSTSKWFHLVGLPTRDIFTVVFWFVFHILYNILLKTKNLIK